MISAPFILSVEGTAELKVKVAEVLRERRVQREGSEVETRVGGITMERRLAIADRRHSERRFSDAPLTDWSAL